METLPFVKSYLFGHFAWGENFDGDFGGVADIGQTITDSFFMIGELLRADDLSGVLLTHNHPEDDACC